MCLSENQSFCLSSSFSSEERELVQLPHQEQLPHLKLFNELGAGSTLTRGGCLKSTCIHIEYG